MRNRILEITKRLILPLILSLVLFLLSFYSVRDLSYTTDEPSHLARGVMLIRTWDLRINQHHPYLFNLIEGLPVALDKAFKGEGLNSVNWQQAKKDDIAVDLVWINGGREYYSSVYLIQGRLVAAISAAVLLFIMYQIFYKYFGFAVTAVSSTLLTFSPTVLAHSGLMTTDVPSMFTIILATMAMCVDVKRSSKKLTFPIYFTLTAFIAILSKYTATLLVPFWFLMLFYIYVFIQKFNWKKVLLYLIGVALSMVLLLTAAYGFKFQTIYTTDYNNPGKIASTYDHLAMIARVVPIKGTDEFLDTLYTKVKVPFPQYIKGFYDNVIKHDIHGHKTYLLGSAYNGGDPRYFPVAFTIKETLPFVALSFFSLIYLAISIKKNWKYIKEKYYFYLPLLLSPLVLLVLSMSSQINIGIRHLLPIYPFLTLGIAITIVDLYNRYFKNKIYVTIVAVLILLHIVSAVSAYPNYIGYFNEIVGNKHNGYLYLQGSNMDWQQEKYLQEKYTDKYDKEGITIVALEDLSTNINRLEIWQRCLRYRYFSGDIKPVGRLGNNYLLFRLGDKQNLCEF